MPTAEKGNSSCQCPLLLFSAAMTLAGQIFKRQCCGPLVTWYNSLMWLSITLVWRVSNLQTCPVDHAVGNCELTFLCEEHWEEMPSPVLHYYISMCMREHSKSVGPVSEGSLAKENKCRLNFAHVNLAARFCIFCTAFLLFLFVIMQINVLLSKIMSLFWVALNLLHVSCK